jgi:hypothetical protein
MAKPRSKPQLSLQAPHVYDDAPGIPADHWSRAFFQHIFCGFDDAQFADLYVEGGRHPVSPSLLAAVTLLQYMFRASDRGAVENTLMRRDWRLALGIAPDYDGFDPTVLVNFRKRLVAHDMQREIFEAVLERIAKLGLLKGRRRVRVDSTQLIANVARLSRADALQEAIRKLVCVLYDERPELRADPQFQRLYETYGEEVWLGRDPQTDERLVTLGIDGRLLLRLCADYPLPARQILEQMLAENFIFSEQDDTAPPQPLPPDQLSSGRIISPHDPDAKGGKKGDKSWVGDKVHIVETADEEGPNFCVDVVTTDARIDDVEMTQTLAERTQQVLPELDTSIEDAGYVSVENGIVLRKMGIDLVAPALVNTRKGFLLNTEFTVDWDRRQATCPAGHESVAWGVYRGETRIQFGAAMCTACPRRAECTRSRHGRTICFGPHWEQLQHDRERAKQPEFQAVYRLRAPIEATISHAVHECGLRRSRYRTAAKRELHAILAVAALNARRLMSHLTNPPAAPKVQVCGA